MDSKCNEDKSCFFMKVLCNANVSNQLAFISEAILCGSKIEKNHNHVSLAIKLLSGQVLV